MADKTVLVVDDVPLNRKLMRAILASRNIRVIEAGDAELAIELTREHRPDLVLMDLKLPGMNGLEAARLLGADSGTAGIPVVIVSAGSMPEEDSRLQEAACAGFLTKPFSSEELMRLVSPFLT